jgi:hypothetical protein
MAATNEPSSASSVARSWRQRSRRTAAGSPSGRFVISPWTTARAAVVRAIRVPLPGKRPRSTAPERRAAVRAAGQPDAQRRLHAEALAELFERQGRGLAESRGHRAEDPRHGELL